MGPVRFFVGLYLLAGAALFAQELPDWFVVELSEPPVERARGARRIRESQAAARAAIAARTQGRAEVRETLEVVMNGLIVRAPGGAAELASIPGVRRVWPVYKVRPELDRAVALLGITRAWEAIGGPERAGAGVKIAIVDTGLDLGHAGFKTDSMQAPEGYPKATNEEIKGRLNGKVIVYRTYDEMLGFPVAAEDRSGHGTGVAMAAAGLKASSQYGEVQGAAPGAWLGVYKVFSGPDGDDSSTAAILKAIDDAVADGMDVINMSLGVPLHVRREYDPFLPALERAAGMGVMVVKSMGNAGPVRSSGSAPSMGDFGITVGASWADRFFGSGVKVNGGEPFFAIPGDGPKPDGMLTGPFRDMEKTDPTGLACAPLPAGSLRGTVVLILRGECTFEQKLTNAARAGATGAVIYTHAASPNANPFTAGAATLPAVMVSNRSGLGIKRVLAATPESTVEISFDDMMPFSLDADGVADFSSRGPGPDGTIRPDVVAIGEEVLTATQRIHPGGELFNASGYTFQFGTSIASPLVAGSYAILKAARPGLRPAEYRTLLVNSAQRLPVAERARPMESGAGRVDTAAALKGQLAIEPVSIAFGLGTQRADVTRRARVRNAGTRVGTWKVEIETEDGMKPAVEPAEFSLGPGDTVDLRVALAGDVPVGETQGHIVLREVGGPEGAVAHRIAYWYGVASQRAASVTVNPSAPATAAAGETVRVTALITDEIGAAITAEAPKVRVLEGSGDVVGVDSAEELYPGYWLLRLRVAGAPGEVNRFRIEAGEVVREVSIRVR